MRGAILHGPCKLSGSGLTGLVCLPLSNARGTVWYRCVSVVSTAEKVGLTPLAHGNISPFYENARLPEPTHTYWTTVHITERTNKALPAAVHSGSASAVQTKHAAS